DTLNGKVVVRLKYEADENVSYDLKFVSADGLKIDGDGAVYVEFLDKAGFSVDKQEFSHLTRGCASDTPVVCTGLSGLGKFHLPVKQFQQIASISVSHNIMMSALNAAKLAPGTNANKKKPRIFTDEDFVSSDNSFDAELDQWDAKVKG